VTAVVGAGSGMVMDRARTVFVVDDDEAARDSLLVLLGSEGLPVQGFASAKDFLDSFDPEAPGCVITDLQMPGMDGLQLMGELTQIGCILPVVVITGHADVSLAVEAMKAGARDFIEKPFDREPILRAVLDCLEAYGSAADAHTSRQLIQSRVDSLTGREREVLDQLLQGASNKVIALRLAISPRTVEVYRANVMAKMRADSLSELVRMAISVGAA